MLITTVTCLNKIKPFIIFYHRKLGDVAAFGVNVAGVAVTLFTYGQITKVH